MENGDTHPRYDDVAALLDEVRRAGVTRSGYRLGSPHGLRPEDRAAIAEMRAQRPR